MKEGWAYKRLEDVAALIMELVSFKRKTKAQGITYMAVAVPRLW